MSGRVLEIVCIEGLIGSGKTTQMKMLKEKYVGNSRVAFVDEPVEEWENLGALEAMYNGHLNRGMFQCTALMSRMAPIMAAMHTEAEVIVTERSPWTDYLVFARANLSGIELDCYAYLFEKMQHTLEQLLTIHASFVYLKCDVDTAMERMKSRARDSEITVPFAYMDLLHRKHEVFIELANDGNVAGQCRFSSSPVRPSERLVTQGYVFSAQTDVHTVQKNLVHVIDDALLSSSSMLRNKNNALVAPMDAFVLPPSLCTQMLTHRHKTNFECNLGGA